MMWHGDWSWADWASMALGMLVFWGAVVALVLWLVARTRGSSDSAPPTQAGPHDSAAHARDVLDERFARGEVSVEEYQTRRDLLTPR
jgi:putative membrane protein